MSDKVMSVTNISAALLDAWAVSERDKHRDCHGACKHLGQIQQDSRAIKVAFENALRMQERIDSQLATLMNELMTNRDSANVLRTFTTAMLMQGWELAAFYLRGQSLDNKAEVN